MIALEEIVLVPPDIERARGVHVIKHDGSLWRAVTNKHFLVAVEAHEPCEESPEAKRLRDVLKRSADAPGTTRNVDAAKLRAWALKVGPLYVWSTECAECEGLGGTRCNLDHWHDCEACHGKPVAGEWTYHEGDIAYAVLFGGVVVNRRYLGRVLESTNAETIEVNVAGPLDPVHLIAPRWRAVIMPCRSANAERAKYPRWSKALS